VVKGVELIDDLRVEVFGLAAGIARFSRGRMCTKAKQRWITIKFPSPLETKLNQARQLRWGGKRQAGKRRKNAGKK